MSEVLEFLVSPVAVGFLAASMRLAAPIGITALGGAISERSGTINIGLEGMMLAGAFAGFVAAFYTSNSGLGFLAAVGAGALIALLLGVLIITLRADQIVAGIALNLLMLGVTSFAYRAVFGPLDQPRIAGVETWEIPGLSSIPVIGPMFFNQTWLVFVAYGAYLVSHVYMFKTSYGLEIEGSGEDPIAAEAMGVRVIAVRYRALIISGAMAGAGGGMLTIGSTHLFVDNMTAGRGYIALAILVLGRRTPLGVMAGALLFGAADALQLRAQAMATGIPFQFLLMLPYVLTILVLAGFVGRSHTPSALGVPYPAKEAS